MNASRTKIFFIVIKLSQNLANPTTLHLNKSKQVLPYLKSTQNQCFMFKKSLNLHKLVGFCDTAWENASNQQSIIGYYFKLLVNNLMIC